MLNKTNAMEITILVKRTRRDYMRVTIEGAKSPQAARRKAIAFAKHELQEERFCDSDAAKFSTEIVRTNV